MSRLASFRRFSAPAAVAALLLLGGCVVYDPYPYYGGPAVAGPDITLAFPLYGGHRHGHYYRPHRYRHHWR